MIIDKSTTHNYSAIMNATGFPSPAQGYEKELIDFNRLLLPHPATTFTMRYAGNTLPAYHLCKGDLIVVDCSLIPRCGQLAVVESEGSFVCKEVCDPCVYQVFGIVTSIVRVL